MGCCCLQVCHPGDVDMEHIWTALNDIRDVVFSATTFHSGTPEIGIKEGDIPSDPEHHCLSSVA